MIAKTRMDCNSSILQCWRRRISPHKLHGRTSIRALAASARLMHYNTATLQAVCNEGKAPAAVTSIETLEKGLLLLLL
eukprot:1356892-Amphidinium_carterae.3